GEDCHLLINSCQGHLITDVRFQTVWKQRNDYVFNNVAVIVEEVVENIKVVSWQWFVGRMAKGPCMLYEWKWSPIDCIKR
ncbi:hypothetical protein L195_g058794, partial [Trifolium pratense]